MCRAQPACQDPLTREELADGGGKEREEGQWVREGDGKDCGDVGHARHHGVEAGQGGVEAEQDEVAHVPAANAVASEETVMVVPQGDSGAHSAEVGAGRGVQSLAGQGRLAGVQVVGRVLDDQDVVAQGVGREEQEEGPVEQRRRAEARGRRVLTHAGQEEEELEREGHQGEAQEISGGHHVEQPQGQHLRLHS